MAGRLVALRGHGLDLEADGLCDGVAREHAHVERVSRLARLDTGVLGVRPPPPRDLGRLEDALDAEGTSLEAARCWDRLMGRKVALLTRPGCDVNDATAG